MSHRYPLKRQTHEGCLVEDYTGDEILNQKREWGCNLPPTLAVNPEKAGGGKRKGRDVPNHDEAQTTNEMPPKPRRIKDKVPKNIREEMEEKKENLNQDRNSPNTNGEKPIKESKFTAKETLANKFTAEKSEPRLSTVIVKEGWNDIIIDGHILE